MKNNTCVMINGTMKNNAMINKLLIPITPILTTKLPIPNINDTEMSLLVNNLNFQTIFYVKFFLLIMPSF